MSLLTGLSAHWALEETGGTRLDSTANNHDLTDNNTVLYEPGKVSRAALFDASNSEFLSVNDHADFSLEGDGNPWTIVWWARVHDGAQCSLITKTTSNYIGSTANGWQIYHRPYQLSGVKRNFWGFTSNNRGAWTIGCGDQTTAGYEMTEYYMGAVRYDQFDTNPEIGVGGFTMYGDSVSKTGKRSLGAMGMHAGKGKTYANPIQGAGSQPLRLGTSNGTSLFLEGGIDEVSIWKRALTEAEIKQLWNEGAGLAYPWGSTYGSEMDWMSTGSLEALHRRHLTPDRTNPLFVQYNYSFSGRPGSPEAEVPEVSVWRSPPEVPVLPREHRLAPYRAYIQETGKFAAPLVSEWWLQASEPVDDSDIRHAKAVSLLASPTHEETYKVPEVPDPPPPPEPPVDDSEAVVSDEPYRPGRADSDGSRFRRS